MTNTDAWLIFAVGFGLGAVIVGGSVLRIRRNVLDKFEQAQSLSDGAAELLEVLSAAALILNPSNLAVRATQGALAFGILQNRTLTSPDLVELVNKTRDSNNIEALDVELTTGLSKDKVYITARAANIGDGNVLLIVDDRTESKRLDETRRDFIANISHELKTPIGALSLLSEAVMEAKEDSEAVTKFASRMQTEAKRLTDLVQEIIQLSRVQDSDPLHEAKVLLASDLIKEALDQCRTTADSRKIALYFQQSEDDYVQGDHNQLTMALNNLIENAINYSPAGTKVSVSTSAENGIISIAVSDQGIGIPEAEVERIFERFYRVDPARSRETGGTGLGLSIVKHIVTKHGGEISVWSSENVGSTFTIRLPIHESIEDHK